MHPSSSPSSPAALADYGALMDLAKCRARVLRRQAIDDFWAGADAAARRAARAAARFAHRLAGHRRQRMLEI